MAQKLPDSTSIACQHHRSPADISSPALRSALNRSRVGFYTLTTAIPSKLNNMLQDLCLCTLLLQLDPQISYLPTGNNTSSSLTVITDTPQSCVLRPLLYSLYTPDLQLSTALMLPRDSLPPLLLDKSLGIVQKAEHLVE